MNKFTGLLLIILCTMGFAHAGELYSPPLTAGSLTGDNFSECVITNISDTLRSVKIEGFDSEGHVLANHTVDVAPNQTRGFSLSESPSPYSPLMFCKFSFRGRAANFRAAIHVVDSGGEGIISALEAR